MKYIKFILFLLLPFAGVLLMETLIRLSPAETVAWVLANKEMYLFSVGLFFTIQLITLALFNNLYLSMLSSLGFWVFVAVGNYYKKQMMGDPLLPWDFMYANQLIDLIPALYKNVNLLLLGVAGIIGIALLYVIIRFTKFRTLNLPLRVLVLLAGIIPLYLTYNYQDNFVGKAITATGAQNIPWNQTQTQEKNGLMLGFIINIPNIQVDKPDDYWEGYMKEIEKEVVEGSDWNYPTSETKPNVVVIMSEAFWELSELGITDENGESLNPTVDAHKIGHIVSPRYGGGTSNVEFEAITGFTMANLLGGAVPYQQYMGREMPSIAHTFSGHGYKTTGIHTFYKYFWNRIQAYEALGFDEFIGLDDLEDPQFYGNLYVDDLEVNNQILNTIESTEEPSFIYAVTMMNHGLYNDNRYGEDTLQVADEYSAENNQILNTLATGFKRSDDLLQQLFDDLKALDEPTLVVFFGDHLPSMTSTYEELGYITSMGSKTLEEELKMKETPLVVWNNYGKEVSELPSISTSFLPPKIMEWAELPAPQFYHLLNEFSNELPAYTSLVKMDKDENLMLATPQTVLELESRYKYIQYDIMFGENYTREALYPIQPE